MKIIKRIISIVIGVTMLLALCSCATTGESGSSEKRTVTIAYQGGIGHTPVNIIEAKKLIEANYGKDDIKVVFKKLNSGADVNTGIIGSTIDVGSMGIGPAVSAVAGGVPCKIISNLCSQSNGLMTNSKTIKSLKDIGANDKIALVNTGSFQHIILAMAAKQELGDAHALDNNITPMAHADGMAALESGTVSLHLTSAPFITRERESGKYTEIDAVKNVWPKGNSFLVALCSTKLESENKELFDAIQKAFADAIDFINNNKEEAAEIISTYLGQDKETTLNDLNDEFCIFSDELKGVTAFSEFMFEEGFVEKEVKISDLKFNSVKGN